MNYETNLDTDQGVPELQRQLENVVGLEGDVIECGTSRGGSACILARTLHDLGRPKVVYAVDSFHGFDRAELERERRAGLTWAPNRAFTSTSLDYVRKKLQKLNLAEHIVLVPGYFSDVLPTVGGPFCLVFIDCDLSESIIYCAETLWPLLTPGGRMVVDDFDSREFRGAKAAAQRLSSTLADDLESTEIQGRFCIFIKRKSVE